MNEQLILEMARPFVKDGRLTYEQFEIIYEMLSLREQYKVVEILFCHDIELYDEGGTEDDEDILLPDIEDEENLSDTEIKEIREQIGELFTDAGRSSETRVYPANGDIQQSNEILCHLIQQGNERAAHDLCVKNRRLVSKYANAYYKYFGNDLDIDDLEQAGYIGLMTAAKRFDISRANAFTTYAIFWIKQTISRQLIDTGYMIRLPVHVIESIGKVTRLEAEYDGKGVEYEDRIPIIAEALEWSEDKVRHCIELRTRFRDTVSLNMMVGEDGDTELFELLPDSDQPTPEEYYMMLERREKIEEVIKQLKGKESEVLSLRFGFRDNEPMTLEEVGDLYKVTRERIRQIQQKAIRRLCRNKT